MKNTLILILSFFTMVSCNNKAEKKNKETPIPESSIGGDKDDHGCLTAAGQTWSELKQDCIQVFNVGVRLAPIDRKSDQTVLSAFVVFNEDKSKCELFLPEIKKGTIVLPKTENESYVNQNYVYDADTSLLYIDGKIKYKKE